MFLWLVSENLPRVQDIHHNCIACVSEPSQIYKEKDGGISNQQSGGHEADQN